MKEKVMADWHSIRMNRADQAKTEQLLCELRELIRGGDPDESVGVFSNQVSDQVVDIFLSPGIANKAGQILHRYWGGPSDPPPSTARHILGSPAALAATT